MSDLVYETLASDQWAEIEALFKEIGEEGKCPAPNVCQIRVARRDGKIVGFFVAQLTVHAEPLWISPEERGRVNWLRMLHDLEGAFLHLLKEYFIFAPNEKIAGMCEAAGLKQLNWKVFHKGG